MRYQPVNHPVLGVNNLEQATLLRNFLQIRSHQLDQPFQV